VAEEERLKSADAQLKSRLDKIKDMVLFRYGSTGVADAIKKAVEVKGLIPVFPVKNLTSFSASNRESRAFQECILVYPGTTVREFARILHPDLDKYFQYAENPDRMRVSCHCLRHLPFHLCFTSL
jgi:ribosome-binding ATPase YchF (GTP1/OBG family)